MTNRLKKFILVTLWLSQFFFLETSTKKLIFGLSLQTHIFVTGLLLFTTMLISTVFKIDK